MERVWFGRVVRSEGTSDQPTESERECRVSTVKPRPGKWQCPRRTLPFPAFPPKRSCNGQRMSRSLPTAPATVSRVCRRSNVELACRSPAAVCINQPPTHPRLSPPPSLCLCHRNGQSCESRECVVARGTAASVLAGQVRPFGQAPHRHAAALVRRYRHRYRHLHCLVVMC